MNSIIATTTTKEATKLPQQRRIQAIKKYNREFKSIEQIRLEVLNKNPNSRAILHLPGYGRKIASNYAANRLLNNIK